MEQDKAGENYWNSVWKEKMVIDEIDINYYTNRLLHNLYQKYFKFDKTKKVLEIGCALSANLLYFNKYFGYQINGFDYEVDAVKKTINIYNTMNYKANIFHRDFFSKDETDKYNRFTPFGVFEHFENIEDSIAHTRHYLKDNGIILTVIPNMNGIIGLLQKLLNKPVYDVHIPYTREDIKNAHEKAGYNTLFCNYYGLYQAGVINLTGNKFGNILRKLLAIPGKPIYYLYKLTKIPFDSKYISPYIIYIGILKP
ncbi:methyltransferase domain-containing protein [Lebetimonas sp. JH369]|uniref:methyltransferase domain-containing protein n=1 Tax=Lebetimonas sp. JH369 TaxID=990069 RepID=UPI000466A87D|nr:methyltransferase domain-containing protein [Lebetimonas sp. JH369]